jgi:hypothetical protein
MFGFVKRHLAENIYDYLPWIFKYSTDQKIRIFASLLFNWMLRHPKQARLNNFLLPFCSYNQYLHQIFSKFDAFIPFCQSGVKQQSLTHLYETVVSDNASS